jgi:hypothetical protein
VRPWEVLLVLMFLVAVALYAWARLRTRPVEPEWTPPITSAWVSETLPVDVRNAIEAAVEIPDPGPVELTRGEKLCIELQAECDHQMVSVWELGMPLSQCIWCGVDDFTPARSR